MILLAGVSWKLSYKILVFMRRWSSGLWYVSLQQLFLSVLMGKYMGILKGGRCLRQGDPISPNLFTLVMEMFNLIMMKNITNSVQFKYHYRCKEMTLSHLCFHDDLLVLCNGDKNSLAIVKKSLEQFSSVSGLGKSTIFFGS